jgi:hypothetical protein
MSKNVSKLPVLFFSVLFLDQLIFNNKPWDTLSRLRAKQYLLLILLNDGCFMEK